MRNVCIGAIGVLLLASCSGESSKSAPKCSAFIATSDKLTSERDSAFSDARSAPPNILPGDNSKTPQQQAYETAQRTLAELYVQDRTGCATTEDKARAQGELDTLNATP